MRRYLSTPAAFLLIFAISHAPAVCYEAAAQELQQSQSSDTLIAAPEKAGALQIRDGTLIEIEAPYTFRSMDFKPNDKIGFRVVNAIKIDGVTAVEQGATATGRIDRSKRGGHWGKAGLLVWTMQTVTAVDGSQIPVRAAPVRLRGDSKGAKVATQMIITGALMPFIAPVALLHGFKRGKDAFIPAGKRYSVFVEGNALVTPETAAQK